MMRPFAILIASAFVIAACGTDGEPLQPEPTEGTEAVPVTGTATVGMSVGSSGTRGYGAVGFGKGPVFVAIGF